MGMPVKLSDDLVRAARAEAAAAERSITSQIEHWARLGRAAEAALSHADALALKACFEGPAEATSVASRSTPQRIHALLMSIARSTDRTTVTAALRAGGRPLYESDPQHPGFVVRVEADGSRTPGRFEGKRFRASPSSTRT